jgi:hypothetical protein
MMPNKDRSFNRKIMPLLALVGLMACESLTGVKPQPKPPYVPPTGLLSSCANTLKPGDRYLIPWRSILKFPIVDTVQTSKGPAIISWSITYTYSEGHCVTYLDSLDVRRPYVPPDSTHP